MELGGKGAEMMSKERADEGGSDVRATNQVNSSGYNYDAAGNLLTDNTHGYVYDGENRLTCVLGTDGTCTSSTAMLYLYDAAGHRVGKQQANGLEDYVYDPQGHITSVHENGGASAFRAEIYTPENRHVATYNPNIGSGPLFWNHTDWLGTERVRTYYNGSSWQTVETCTDSPYGMNLLCAGQSDTSPMHFTGKQRDYESGLDYFGARYFAAGTNQGRWMSPDFNEYPATVPYADFTNPQTLNLYEYLSNNPFNATDPTGHARNSISLGGKDIMIVDASSHDQVNVHIKTRNGEFRGRLNPDTKKVEWTKGAPPKDIAEKAQDILVERGKYDIAQAKKEMSYLGGTRKGEDEEEEVGSSGLGKVGNTAFAALSVIDFVANEVVLLRINSLEGSTGFHLDLNGSIKVTNLEKYGETMGTGARVSFKGDTFTLQDNGAWTDQVGNQLIQNGNDFEIECPLCSN